jgi:hypothetical protein
VREDERTVGGEEWQEKYITERNGRSCIVKEAGWDPGLVWMGAENLASTGDQSLDCPAHSKLLHQLHYPELTILCTCLKIITKC